MRVAPGRVRMSLEIPEVRGGEIDLAALWRGLVDGRFFVVDSHYRGGRSFATLKASGDRPRGPSMRAVRVLERVLAGESQKAVASDLGVTAATIGTHCSDALRAFAYERLSSRAPILVVMAAMAARGCSLPRVRLEEKLTDGWVVSVEMPGRGFVSRLSPVEWEVARSALEGKTHAQIARARGTSLRTIANQLSSVFGKLRASGRAELRAKAVAECARSSRVA